MFLIETITVIPSRIARKLVNNWLFRSKISRKTRVRNRMDSVSLLLGAATARTALAAGAWIRLRRGQFGHELLFGCGSVELADHGTGRSQEHDDRLLCSADQPGSPSRNAASLSSRAFTRTISVAGPYFCIGLEVLHSLGNRHRVLRVGLVHNAGENQLAVLQGLQAELRARADEGGAELVFIECLR